MWIGACPVTRTTEENICWKNNDEAGGEAEWEESFVSSANNVKPEAQEKTMTNAFEYFPRMRRWVARSSAEQCLVMKIVVTRDARVDNESRDSPGGLS